MVEVESSRPSPFAESLLFDYIATYMYEGDTPVAERRAQALTLDRALLAELLSAGDLRELLDAEAIDEVEGELQRRGRALSADELHDLLRRGATSTAEGPEAAIQLVRERRAVEVRIAGRGRLIAAEDAGLYRDGVGVAIPPGCRPPTWSRSTTRSSGWCCATPAATGRSRPTSCVSGWGSTPLRAGRRWPAEGAADRGRLPARRQRAGSGWSRTCCGACGGARWRGCDGRWSRSSREALVRFLPGWQGIGRDLAAATRALREVISQLGGVPLAVAASEQDVLPLRVPGYQPPLLDALCAAGEVVWIGAGEARVVAVPARRCAAAAARR